MAPFSGPVDTVGASAKRLTPSVTVTRGRTCVVEGPSSLALIDPGDEVCTSAPSGVLFDVASVMERTGKPVSHILVTHAHPDHVANLDTFTEYLAGRGSPAMVTAHANSPVVADLLVTAKGLIEGFESLEALTGRGHSPWEDDLSFFHREESVLFSGDLVQPKGESWTECFYPSPYPYFTDGDVYVTTLNELLAIGPKLLVTGHREVREGSGWIETTARAIRRVEELVLDWEGSNDPVECGRKIFRTMCDERRIPPEVVEKRMNPTDSSGKSPFDLFDMPPITYYWNKHRSQTVPT